MVAGTLESWGASRGEVSQLVGGSEICLNGFSEIQDLLENIQNA